MVFFLSCTEQSGTSGTCHLLMLIPRTLTGPNETEIVCAIYFKKAEQQYDGNILTMLQLPQRCSVPEDLSFCFCCSGQSLSPSLLPATESAFRCTALLCTPNHLHVYFRNCEFMVTYQNIYLKIPNEQQRTCRNRLTKGRESRATSDATVLCTLSLQGHLPKTHHCDWTSHLLLVFNGSQFWHEHVVERTCVTAQTPSISSHMVLSHPLL